MAPANLPLPSSSSLSKKMSALNLMQLDEHNISPISGLKVPALGDFQFTYTTPNVSPKTENNARSASPLKMNGVNGIYSDPKYRLYFDDDEDSEVDETQSEWHEMVTAPLLTHSVLQKFNSAPQFGEPIFKGTSLLPQSEESVSPFVSYGGLGRVIKQYVSYSTPDMTTDIIYMNTNTPSTTMICGVQGSGKSHTVSVIIENSLIKADELGLLPEPLSVVVFHLGAAQGGMHLPCESAFLQNPSNPGTKRFKIPVRVLASPSNLTKMKTVYATTGAQVVPFYLSTRDLNSSRMFGLMHVTDDGDVPLYIQVVQQILRDMGHDAFNYRRFKQEIANCREFTPQQKGPLDLRIKLLEAMLLECHPRAMAERVKSVKQHFEKGVLTIVDLTDPYINASTASALFDIALSLYLETPIPSGKLLVLDEAHKYLTNATSTSFVESILSVIRQQRHLGIRTVISTQEPTVIPENMFGLCSTVICHRFSSPAWWNHLHRQIGLSNKFEGFDVIARLRTGEGIVFSPMALGMATITKSEDVEVDAEGEEVRKFGGAALLVKVRRKVTCVTGKSVLSKKV